MIGLRQLGRQPGTMRRHQASVPAPDGFGIEGVIGVPPGAPVVLDLRLEAVSEGVFVSGTATATAVGECARCLDEVTEDLVVELMELYAYPDSATEASTDPDEISRVVDDSVDVEQAVRDAIVLALPLAPLCTPDCAGLCPECGGRRAELGPEHRHETMDPRWAALLERGE